ncbi:MAG: M17 family peptidase N-terminal domain-containing protein, partial [Cyanobium sp.]
MDFLCIPDALPAVLDHWDGDCLAVGLFADTEPSGEGQPDPAGLAQLAAFDPSLPARLEQRRFKAKPGTCLSLERLDASPQTLILVGLGAPADFSAAVLIQASAAASQAAAAAGARHLGLAMPLAGLELGPAAAAMAEAVRLSLFSDQRFKGESEPRTLPATVSLIGVAEAAQQALAAVGATCAGVELARELVAAPPNVATPQHLVDTAAAIARDFGGELQVLNRSDCEALGMGAFLGVAQGSDLAPQFIHLTLKPAGPVQRRIALVGKGLTFDSGGYNLKTAGSQIEMMKYDMGGSAAVLGAARALAELKPEGMEVHVIVAACENMISGGAVHPGDI